MSSKFIGATVLISMLSGCASVTPVTPAGKDTYYISAVSGTKASAELKSMIYIKADTYCKSAEKNFSPVHEYHDDVYGGLDTAELTFRCYDRNSSNYQPPNMTPVPHVIIESK